VSQYLGGRSPIGYRLHMPDGGPDDEATVIGVAGNGRYRSLGEAQMAAIYRPYRQQPRERRNAHVLVRTDGDPAGLVRPVTQAIGGLDPTAAVEVQTTRQALAFAFLPSRLGAALVGGLGLIGLVLAMAGLFAMVSYSVSRRTKEIGVRIALGAPRAAVIRLVAGDALLLVSLGLCLGLGTAAVLIQPLALFLVSGLSPHDPLAFAGTAILFTIVAAVATIPPIRRAIGVGPLTALRTE
jgi:predicted lysophospholipase L1 biosynthesis ABC-type transport system permease subunit